MDDNYLTRYDDKLGYVSEEISTRCILVVDAQAWARVGASAFCGLIHIGRFATCSRTTTSTTPRYPYQPPNIQLHECIIYSRLYVLSAAFGGF